MLVVVVLVVAVLVTLFVVSLFVRRHREAAVPAGDWQCTDEVFIDPGTGRRMRVWLDPTDGSRNYVPDGRPPGHT